MDVTKLCRGCMKEVASWEKENFYTRAVEMFSFCTNIRIKDEDYLPKQFCYDCIIKIESSYTFITEAQKVNVTLKNIISRKTSVIVQSETAYKSQGNLDIKLTLPDYKICSVIETPKQSGKKVSETEKIGLENSPNSIKNVITKPEILEQPENSTECITVEQKVETAEKIDSHLLKCTQCSKSFKTKTWYQKHLQRDHAGKKYTCTQCPKSFSVWSQLRAHSVSHSEERAWACGAAACGARYKRRSHLAQHAPAHSARRPYACHHCAARFKKKSILKSHMAVHDTAKKFLCYFCGWSFAQAGNLSVHMRVHTGEKPFACGACAFRAAAASNLRRHQRTHAADKSLLCARCGKGFNDASNLARHRRTHTGALPYSCGSCGARFADSWKRTAHLVRVHTHTLRDVPRVRTHTHAHTHAHPPTHTPTEHTENDA